MLLDDAERLMQTLGYRFSDRALLKQALTHRSAGQQHNERLEFLGDALLGFIIAEELYRRFPNADEGQLTRLRASLVRKESLAALAHNVAIGSHLQLGEGELKSGGYRRESILANALEALIGAIYVDGGFDACRQQVIKLFESTLLPLSPDDVVKDPKTDLQEWLQARHLALPTYRMLDVSGEPHNQRFTVECELSDLAVSVRGQGRSRRQAEQQAAAQALNLLRNTRAAV